MEQSGNPFRVASVFEVRVPSRLRQQACFYLSQQGVRKRDYTRCMVFHRVGAVDYFRFAKKSHAILLTLWVPEEDCVDIGDSDPVW